MRSAILLALLFGLAAAVPRPQDETEPSDPEDDEPEDTEPSSDFMPTVTTFAAPSLTLSISITDAPVPESTSTKGGHSERIPVLMSKCECPDLATVPYPCYAWDQRGRCNFEWNHSYACYMSAQRGCPSPTQDCGVFPPQTVTGRHPCDLSPNTGIPAPVITVTASVAVPTTV
ncbi:hypothetical protein P154DRAFT_112198 [Amniculicola lignicola CBS 123094]|uniref:Extracellular membrane protein CFEM domain-containing protein n=1 Tax=Amniculicola lignicola CBS 123094 TaxID=1392246 RepID=A0A6A5WSJ7_9PLEO|nr:hypothetical protein P154DRAFT_112198 [Amniculicola lignicola CBS 123094]